MFYIRAFDCITTLLIFRGSAGGQGALSRLTSGSQEPEPQSGTWQWMSPNDLDGICYTARRKPISQGNLAVEKKQRFKNKPHLFQIGVMLPHQCSTSLEFPSRMTNNYTQMTTQQLWMHRRETHCACSCLGNWVQEMQPMILDCLFVYSVLKWLHHLVKEAFDGGGPSQEPLQRIRWASASVGLKTGPLCSRLSHLSMRGAALSFLKILW